VTESTNTGENRKPGTFVKGDPRINRKGRPKSFDALRELAKEIAHEIAKQKNGEPVRTRDGKPLTVTEAILRSWSSSTNPKLQQAFIEIAYGKTPAAIELTGRDGAPLEITTQVVRSRAAEPEVTPSADGETVLP
jgi:hypothetical protein